VLLEVLGTVEINDTDRGTISSSSGATLPGVDDVVGARTKLGAAVWVM
jgi:hypothetical protein